MAGFRPRTRAWRCGMSATDWYAGSALVTVSPSPAAGASHGQVLRHRPLVPPDLLHRPGELHPALLQDVAAVAHLLAEPEVLVGEDDGDAQLLDHRDHLRDVRDDER